MKQYVFGDKNVLLDHINYNKPLSWVGNFAAILCVYFFKLFGFTPLTLRFLPATAGVVSILAVFFLCKKLFGSRPALLAAFFMTVLPWHIFFSRVNSPQPSLTVMHSIITYIVLLTAFKRQNTFIFAILGFCMGLSMYVYEPGKFTLVGAGSITILFILLNLIKDHTPQAIIKHSIYALFIAVFFGITIIPYVRWGLNERSYFYSAGGPQFC